MPVPLGVNVKFASVPVAKSSVVTPSLTLVTSQAYVNVSPRPGWITELPNVTGMFAGTSPPGTSVIPTTGTTSWIETLTVAVELHPVASLVAV